MEFKSEPQYEQYFERIDILVNRLKEYLIKTLETDKREYNLLIKEKEGWVEYQYLEWLEKEIKEKYGWNVWDIHPIDVMAQLTCLIVRYLNSV